MKIEKEIVSIEGIELVFSEYPPDMNMEPHKDQHSKLSIIIQGNVREMANGGTYYAGFCDVVIKPKEVRHANRFGPRGAKVLTVLDVDNYTEGLKNAAKLNEWNWFSHTQIHAGAMDVIKSLKRDTGDIKEAFGNLIYKLHQPSLANKDSKMPDWLAFTKKRIDDEFSRSPQIKELAQSADVHPVYLTSLFKKFYGLPISTYIRQRRVQAAVNAITFTKRSFSEVALECGFYDQSHMCRDFQLVLGQTPGSMR